MPGSTPYWLKKSDKFERSFRACVRSHYKKDKKGATEFGEELREIAASLVADPRMHDSSPEPWPPKAAEDGQEFRKIYFRMPRLQGAAREGRLMYLVHHAERTVVLLWVYTHAEYEKRPPAQDLATLIRETRDSIGDKPLH